MDQTTTTRNRETLEHFALQAVCECYHYDLATSMDEMSNEELFKIATDPQSVHYKFEELYPTSPAEFAADLAECPSYNKSVAEARS